MSNEDCPTCRNGLWHPQHVCYTDAELAEARRNGTTATLGIKDGDD